MILGMTTVDTVGMPTRYRAAEKRGARLGRPLRLAGRIGDVDEELLERLGRGFMETDELGGRLAKAMRLPADDPNRVTMAPPRATCPSRVSATPLRSSNAPPRRMCPSPYASAETRTRPVPTVVMVFGRTPARISRWTRGSTTR